MIASTKNLAGELQKSFPDLKIALLYGSFGTERQNRKSDIDIAVAANAPLSDHERIQIIDKIESLTGRNVDLIDLLTVSGTVFKEALLNARFLFNLDTDLLARIHSRMLAEEADFQVTRGRLAAEARKRVFSE
jgi:predicted nucleotidyltransferase